MYIFKLGKNKPNLNKYNEIMKECLKLLNVKKHKPLWLLEFSVGGMCGIRMKKTQSLAAQQVLFHLWIRITAIEANCLTYVSFSCFVNMMIMEHVCGVSHVWS